MLVAGADAVKLMTLPLLAGGVCILTSIIGTYFVRLGGGSIMGALYKGFLVTAVLSIPALWFATHMIFPDMNAVIGGSAEATSLDTAPGGCRAHRLHRDGPVLVHAGGSRRDRR